MSARAVMISFFMVVLLLVGSLARLRFVRIRRHDVDHRVRSAMALQQSLMRGSEEREAREEVLVIRLDALGEAGARIARGDEAEQHGVDVDLMLVRLFGPRAAAARRESRGG